MGLRQLRLQRLDPVRQLVNLLLRTLQNPRVLLASNATPEVRESAP